jgi:Zn-dependent metalloprotease
VFVREIDAGPRPGGPVAAARAHLSADAGRYRVENDNLRVLDVLYGDDFTTVRFGQTYKGREVFGAQYLVHMTRGDAGYAAQSVNGNYFTELRVDVTPRIGAGFARRLAVRRTRAIMTDRVEPHGLVALPHAHGIPAYHFTLWGRRLIGGQARHEVFVNSLTGATMLSYNNIQTDGPVVGRGIDAHSEEHALNLYQRGSVFEMRDQARDVCDKRW